MTGDGDGSKIPMTAGDSTADEPDPGSSIAPGSTSEVLLNWAGFFVGLLVMTGDYVLARRSLSPKSWEFLASPKAIVWILFVAGQFAFWANVLEPLWRWGAKVRSDFDLRHDHAIRFKLAGAVAFFALPGFFLVYVEPDSNLAHHDVKMAIVNLFAVMVALVAVAGIWDVRAALEATFAQRGTAALRAGTHQERVKILVDLRRTLQRLITVLGAMVALATLAKGALRQAILATGGTASEFPPEYVLLQGAYFTGLLALVYIPTYTLFADVGGRLVDGIYPLKSAEFDWQDLSRWQANRKSLEDLLQLKTGALHNLRASVAILAPVATSVAAVLLGSK